MNATAAGALDCHGTTQDALVAKLSPGEAIPSAVRFRLSNPEGEWVADQYVFKRRDNMFSDRIFSIYDDGSLVRAAPLNCSPSDPHQLVVTPSTMHVDIGNDMELLSIVLGRDTVSIRLDAFFFVFEVPPPQVKLRDAPYYFQLDQERPVVIIVTGGLHQEVAVRFQHLKPGNHTLTFYPAGGKAVFALPPP